MRGADPTLEEGVYAALPGPHYETAAEIRMLRTLGADLVGMSTALEAIAARAEGLEVLGVSLVTNLAAGMTGQPLDHAEVLAAGADLRRPRGGAAREGGAASCDDLAAQVRAWVADDPDPATRAELTALLAAPATPQRSPSASRDRCGSGPPACAARCAAGPRA